MNRELICAALLVWASSAVARWHGPVGGERRGEDWLGGAYAWIGFTTSWNRHFGSCLVRYFTLLFLWAM